MLKMTAVKKGIIASWKDDTPAENRLALLAGNSEEAKVQYCEYYRTLDEAYFNTGLEMARRIIRERGIPILGLGAEKSEEYLIRDMIYSLHCWGHSFEEYFDYRLYEKTPFGKNEFISDKMRFEYYYAMNSEEGIALLNDKGQTSKVFEKYYKRETIVAYSKENKKEFVDFASRHPRFVYKPNNSSGGRGVHVEEVNNQSAESLFDRLIGGGSFIAEEIIHQSDDIAALHPASLNTVRIPTVRNNDGVHVFHPFFRMGHDGSVVDNASAGGIVCSVDADSGVVKTVGVTKGDNTFVFHPNSNIAIPGFKIPEWDDAINLVKELAMVLPNVHFTGWDLAHTNNGWVLVEANGCGQFCAQKSDQKGHRRELMDLMANM